MGKYCNSCGNELQGEAKFCATCGTAVLSGSEPAMTQVQPEKKYQPKTQESTLQGENGGEYKVNSSGKSGSKIPLVLALLFFLQAVTVLLFGWPGYFSGVEKEVKFLAGEIVDGIYQADGLSVNFHNNPDIRSFGIAKTEKAHADEGTVSDTYEFAFETVPQKSITVSVPAPKDFTLGADEMLYLDIGVAVTGDGGKDFMVYDFVKAKVADGRFTAAFVPAHYADPVNTVNTGGIPIDQRTHTDKFRFQTAYTVKKGKVSGSGHFKLIFDSVKTKTAISDEQVTEILSRMEQVYNQMDSFGFDMSARTSWPMEIHTKQFAKDEKTNIIMSGQYVLKPWGINYSHININRDLFENNARDHIIAVFSHEFTHFVYHCKVPLGKQLKWLNEGMAAYFEDYFGGQPEYSSRFPQLFDGIYPAADSGRAGYARPSVISYWVENNDSLAGGDSLSPKSKMSGLIKLLSAGGYVKTDRWHNWITACLKDPGKYAVDFYTKAVLCDESVWGDKGGILPYRMYKVITSPEQKLGTWDKVKNFFGKYTEMNTDAELNRTFAVMKLSAAEITSEKGQEYAVKVPGYGARIVALSMTASEQKKIAPDGTLSISAPGGETLVLFKIRSKKVETQQGAALSLADFAKTLKDKYCYMVLLVNTANKEKDISFKVACGEGLPLDEIIGAYDVNYVTTVSRKGHPRVAKEGNRLVFSGTYDFYGELPAVTLSYDPLTGRAYGEHTYSKMNATAADEITLTYKLYFKREKGSITMTGVGSQKTNGSPSGNWSYKEKKIK